MIEAKIGIRRPVSVGNKDKKLTRWQWLLSVCAPKGVETLTKTVPENGCVSKRRGRVDLKTFCLLWARTHVRWRRGPHHEISGEALDFERLNFDTTCKPNIPYHVHDQKGGSQTSSHGQRSFVFLAPFPWFLAEEPWVCVCCCLTSDHPLQNFS